MPSNPAIPNGYNLSECEFSEKPQEKLTLNSDQPSGQWADIIGRNWKLVRQQVAEACSLAGREPSEVKILGVAKYVGPELTAMLFDAGCHCIGENRPQMIWEKNDWFQSHRPADLPQPSWHLIGHLQRNKVRRTLPLVSQLDAIDSWRLAQEVSNEAGKLGLEIPLLIDVNLTQDESKTGMTVDEVWKLREALAALPHVRWQGLMAMSSFDASSDQARCEFAAVRQLQADLASDLGDRVQLTQLSMGMSGDFREAIAEGSTCVRIGSNLWTGL
jgi:pyridoxal phosphate enzyme (YggS family)